MKTNSILSVINTLHTETAATSLRSLANGLSTTIIFALNTHINVALRDNERKDEADVRINDLDQRNTGDSNLEAIEVPPVGSEVNLKPFELARAAIGARNFIIGELETVMEGLEPQERRWYQAMNFGEMLTFLAKPRPVDRRLIEAKAEFLRSEGLDVNVDETAAMINADNQRQAAKLGENSKEILLTVAGFKDYGGATELHFDELPIETRIKLANKVVADLNRQSSRLKAWAVTGRDFNRMKANIATAKLYDKAALEVQAAIDVLVEQNRAELHDAIEAGVDLEA